MHNLKFYLHLKLDDFSAEVDILTEFSRPNLFKLKIIWSTKN